MTVPTLSNVGLSNWMRDVCTIRPEILDWPIERLHYPGTHDSGTYGTGMFDGNWKCQDLNFSGQAELGIRSFDLRLVPKKNSDTFWPNHGAVSDVANGETFSTDRNNIGGANTICGQLTEFIEKHPTEIIILNITLEDTNDDQKESFSAAIMRFFENKLIYKRAYFASREPDLRVKGKPDILLKGPSLSWCRDNKKNFIISINPSQLGIFDGWKKKNQDSFSLQQLMDVSWGIWSKDIRSVRQDVDSYLWTDENPTKTQPPYNDPVWKSGDWQKVASTLEAWMQQWQSNLADRTQLWMAQCQLTPNFGSLIPITDGIRAGFRDIAAPIGALMNTDYSARKLSDLINPNLQENVVKRDLWIKLASVMQVDFPTPDLVRAIVGMNLVMPDSKDWRD